jgi:hypothetical protein
MKLNRTSARRPYPTRGSPVQSFLSTLGSPTDSGELSRPRLAIWLAAVMLVALAIVGSPAATAAKRNSPHPPSCADATGARWHIRHFFLRYDSHGAMLGESSRLPASGDRYVVNAGGADCALAHKSMRRLTSAIPDRALTGKRVEQFFVPPGYGFLFQSPHGFFCAATLNETHSPLERGDNRHLGYCASLNHRGSFSWTAATPNPEKYKPR